MLQSWFTRDLATATHFQKQVSDHWLPECGLCCSEPETYDIHRIKLPPRISSRQGDRPQFSLSDIKEGQDLSPLPVEVETLLISAFSSPRRVSSFSLTNSTSSCAPSSSASLRCKRAKPIVPPPPLNTDRPTSSTRFRKAPSTPLTSTPASPFRALLLRPIQPYLPYMYPTVLLCGLMSVSLLIFEPYKQCGRGSICHLGGWRSAIHDNPGYHKSPTFQARR